MADEYIKRESAINKLLQCADDYDPDYSDITVAHAVSKIKEIPAADVVAVVRCKDCKYAEIASMGHLSVCKHPKGMIDPNPNSYCSYGERRTNDD